MYMCRKGIEGLLSCVAGVCSRGVGTIVAGGGSGEWREEVCCSTVRGESCGAVPMCVGDVMKMGCGCGTAGVRWKLVYVSSRYGCVFGR